jgi:NADH-quinone oxidoreductase subunit L
VVKPVYAAAGLSRFLDREVVDTYVRGAAQGSWLLGGLLRRTQNGNVRIYLTGLFAGVVILTVAVLV